MLYRKADGFLKSFEFQVCQAPTSPRAKIWYIQMISPRFCRKVRIWVPWNKVTKNRRSSHKCTGLWYLHRLSHWIAIWRIKHTKKSVSLPIVWLKLYDFEYIYIIVLLSSIHSSYNLKSSNLDKNWREIFTLPSLTNGQLDET